MRSMMCDNTNIWWVRAVAIEYFAMSYIVQWSLFYERKVEFAMLPAIEVIVVSKCI